MLRIVPVLIALLLAIAGCGDGDGDAPQRPTAAAASFEEGTLRVEIETLDTGLLKGHAYADAADGWSVAELRVVAEDDSGVTWQVIEPERNGIGGANASVFFEVVIQELPRGDQLNVEAISVLQGGDGATVERRVVDKWPP